MTYYAGIDLHSNNHVLVVIDEHDTRVFEKRLPNNLEAALSALRPFEQTLKGVAIESTFNWYWLVESHR